MHNYITTDEQTFSDLLYIGQMSKLLENSTSDRDTPGKLL